MSGISIFEGISTYRIVRIEYEWLGRMRNDGKTPMPEYGIVPAEKGLGGTTSVNESELELVSRGNVWKYFNGEKPEFSSFEDEVRFFSDLGHTKEVRNPANDLYRWSKEEVLKAIQEGIVDGMTGGSGLFGGGTRISAITFKDRELGKRVSESTLRWFGLMA